MFHSSEPQRARRRSALAPACAGLFACAALVAPIRVPRELSDHVRLELSGAVWSQTLARYVLVSDDVNEDGAKHLPQLFTLTDDGKIDATAIRIEGIDELNDPESVTLGPDATLFVCTSHSLNKKGHSPQSRRRLLQLALAPDRTAKVIGQLDLTGARGADGAPPWGTQPGLDIEALAFRDGALFIGLKAPLAADGSATILRLPEAAAAVRAGVIPSGSLTVWARPRLCISRDARDVCEGVVDLAFLADGSLLAAANSPKGMPSDGGGALWKLNAAGGAPQLLKRFDGLKPEGVALAKDRSSAIVVFDTDGQPPLWIRWALP